MTAIDAEFGAKLTIRRTQGGTICGNDAGGGCGGEYLLGALTHDMRTREAREALESAVGEYVAAVLDILCGDADRNVVEHRLQELFGRGEFARKLALLADIEMR